MNSKSFNKSFNKSSNKNSNNSSNKSSNTCLDITYKGFYVETRSIGN